MGAEASETDTALLSKTKRNGARGIPQIKTTLKPAAAPADCALQGFSWTNINTSLGANSIEAERIPKLSVCVLYKMGYLLKITFTF